MAQVKDGKWNVDSLKAFRTVTQQRRAAVGSFITLDRPKVPSARQIRSQMGYVNVAGNKYRRMRLWSIEQYFDAKCDRDTRILLTFKHDRCQTKVI